MGDLIDDDLLGAFAVVGPPDEVPGLLRERLAGVVDRLSFYAPMRLTRHLDPDAAPDAQRVRYSAPCQPRTFQSKRDT